MKLLGALALCLIPQTVGAGAIGDWYKSLKVPGTGMSCCDISDCSTLRDDQWRIREGRYEVYLSGAWMAVSPERVLNRSDNPTGKAVLCATSVIYCFQPGEMS